MNALLNIKKRTRGKRKRRGKERERTEERGTKTGKWGEKEGGRCFSPIISSVSAFTHHFYTNLADKLVN